MHKPPSGIYQISQIMFAIEYLACGNIKHNCVKQSHHVLQFIALFVIIVKYTPHDIEVQFLFYWCRLWLPLTSLKSRLRLQTTVHNVQRAQCCQARFNSKTISSLKSNMHSSSKEIINDTANNKWMNDWMVEWLNDQCRCLPLQCGQHHFFLESNLISIGEPFVW